MTMQFIMYVRKNELKHMRNAQLGLRSVSCTAEDQVEFADFTSYAHMVTSLSAIFGLC